MKRICLLALVALFVSLAPAQAAVKGQYLEARTCDVWTGPCFANADFNLAGKNAVMAWRIDQGSFDNVALDGLGIVAVIAASDTLGLKQTAPTKAIFIVDKKASQAQRDALVRFAQKQGGSLLSNVAAIYREEISFNICECKEGGCAELTAGKAVIQTRCISAEHDKVCGNESAYYPPLVSGVNARPATALEASYRGEGLSHTWREFDRRGAYVGTFDNR
jgi:Protein of unknown function (DUF1326)